MALETPDSTVLCEPFIFHVVLSPSVLAPLTILAATMAEAPVRALIQGAKCIPLNWIPFKPESEQPMVNEFIFSIMRLLSFKDTAAERTTSRLSGWSPFSPEKSKSADQGFHVTSYSQACWDPGISLRDRLCPKFSSGWWDSMILGLP